MKSDMKILAFSWHFESI